MLKMVAVMEVFFKNDLKKSFQGHIFTCFGRFFMQFLFILDYIKYFTGFMFPPKKAVSATDD
jgi:hypothetical protein